MTRLYQRFLKLPIKWKLAIWSTILLTVLFFLYNSLQYIVIDRWIYGQAEARMEESVSEITGYFADKQDTLTLFDVMQSRSFLRDVNDKGQFIRIIDRENHPIVEVSNRLPLTTVRPQYSEVRKLMNIKRSDDTHILLIRVPLKSDYFTGTIEIARNQEDTDQMVTTILLIILAASLSAVILNGLGGYFLSRQLLMPIQSITDTMQRIHEEDLSMRVDFYDNGDELSRLSKIFNEMMNRLETSFYQQKQFVEDASHELRTPVAIIEGHLSLLQRWGKGDPQVLDESLQASLQEIRRLSSLVEELLYLSRAESLPDSMEVRQYDPTSVMEHIAQELRTLHSEFTIETDLSPLERIEITLSADHLTQILIILLDNAIKYSGDSRSIILRSEAKDGFLILEIIDFGLGIPEEEVPLIFDRFYRINKERSREKGGNGLGLSIAKRLVERAGGTIKIASKENEGTTVTLSIPIK
ncbi:HAMP domain-containing histidine kinase [Aneurinibacillus sp. Ricciae_BoGa-3]|uniref:sensor histidine kinase n=1 Tax=Aneurinibacillus sp. Ricciae_BoGa-3 TaxID=3022697 RepID=UPI002340B691|nr:HAMP domain-containing histidine kinase [Aneurinibacillus sp. Ricciae_BoGa-3]WCK53542.1 HAMP domain-containing histidine kinase [Aneurinibacillus sp. Ricciae_BoGa-3]